jgi:hypothetical protein
MDHSIRFDGPRRCLSLADEIELVLAAQREK